MESEFPDLHLEITSKCALACPACPRTYHKGDYKVTDLPLKAIERLVSSGKRYEMVTLCGDHGDPIYHSQFHEVLQLLHKLPGQPWISVSTNGSHRSEAWWKKTASLMRHKDHFLFGIDGLEDTSHIYRRNNDWASIMQGMKILKTESRCQVRWQWILFKFNEHQLSGAAKIAKELQLDRFMIIGSSRHAETDPWKPDLSIEQAEQNFKAAYDLS